MQHISTKSNIMVAVVELSFEEIYQKPYFAVQYMEEIRRANLLLIPSENIREGLEPVFPEFSSDFLRYLRTNAGEGVYPDIAVDDEHYHRLNLHSYAVPLPTMMVREEILEQTMDLCVGYLNDLAGKYNRHTDEMDTFVNIIAQKGTLCRKVMFRGRVSELREAFDAALKQVFYK